MSVPSDRGMMFKDDGWTCWSLLSLKNYDIRSLSSEKGQPSFLRQPQQQKCILDQDFSEHLEGPLGNCDNTPNLEQSVDGSIANMTVSGFKVACESRTRRSSPGYFLKIPFPSWCWQASYSLGQAAKLQGEQLPLGTFVLTLICIWICPEKSADASTAQLASPGLASGPQNRGGGRHSASWYDQLREEEGRPCGFSPRLCAGSKDLLPEAVAGHLLSPGRPQICGHYPQTTAKGLGQLKFGQFRWYTILLPHSSS